MKKSYQRKRLRRLAAILSAVLAMGTAGFSPVLYANPILDSKDAAVSISGTTNMDISSTAANNVIKWVDFSIGAGEKVAFDANNYLNYVTGSARSEIYGMLTGGGSIYLINPNGILIGDSAAINVGNLYLSTRNLSEAQLAAFTNGGADPLLTAGNVTGDVINLGKLNANSVTVEGNNITFKNVADVTSGATLGDDDKLTGGTQNKNVKLSADSEIHLGYANEPEATAVNAAEYATVNEPTLTGWTTSGTTYKYMLVRNEYELQNMRNNLAGNYMLARDIDMSGFENFEPIGTMDFENRFKGNFDGLNHTIRNLNINKSTNSDIGLFGCNSGKIENVGMVGGLITGLYRVGGLAGSNNGTIKHVYNTGTVNGTDEVGGIVGQNNGGTVGIAYNTGAVRGTNHVGGIVGQNNDGGTVEISYNTGAVSGANWVGGIVGQNNDGGTVEIAYNTGTVNGASWVGGIVGQNNGNTVNVYNAGEVTATGSHQGLIVGQQNGTLTKAYSSSDGNLKKAATFTGFDFDANGFSKDGAWRIYEDKTMPLLTAFLTRKDRITSQTEYNGTADAGATYTATTYNDVQAQNGDNYINDVSIVTPKAVTVTFGETTKVYDGTIEAKADAAASIEGVIAADTGKVGATAVGAYADKNAGDGITVSYDASNITLTGAKAGNYKVTANATGIGSITRKALSLVADPVSITEGAATPTAFSGNLTGFVAGEDLAAGDSYAFHLSGTPTAVGKYAITGTLTVGENDPATSGNYGKNYTFANAEGNATAFAINAKPAPAPSSGSSSGSSGGSGNSGSVTPTIPTVPTDIAPANSATSDHSASGTPSSGSATPTNPAAPADTASNANPASAPTANPTGSPAIADAIPAARGTAAEGVAVAALAETENIASSIAADTAAHRSAASVADVGHEGLSPSSAGPAPAGNPSGAAAPTGQLAGEAQNPQRFTWTAGGILAVADMAVNEPNAMSEASFAASQTARQETTPAPGRAMDGATPTASGGTNAAAAGEATNPQSSDALMEQVEQTDLAIGTEESDTNNDNTAASAPANDAGEGTGDSDEKKKQR